MTNTLPKIYYKASLYIPKVPTVGKEEYLTSIVFEKNCKFASILDFNDLHILRKLADEYNYAVVYFNSNGIISVSPDTIAEFRYYKKLSVFENKKIHAFAENLLVSTKSNNSEDGESVEEETETQM
uniref:Uncharacterized protein n=1 Tax=Panagrolaimus davidi TaxID=227884 RepID=A0A914QHF2_9BILA